MKYEFFFFDYFDGIFKILLQLLLFLLINTKMFAISRIVSMSSIELERDLCFSL